MLPHVGPGTVLDVDPPTAPVPALVMVEWPGGVRYLHADADLELEPRPPAVADDQAGRAGFEDVGSPLDELVSRVADGCGMGRLEAREALRAALDEA